MDLMKGQASKEEINKSLSHAQKVLDKASKEKVIHKNKANRLKSKVALKIAKKENDQLPAAKTKKSKSSK